MKVREPSVHLLLLRSAERTSPSAHVALCRVKSAGRLHFPGCVMGPLDRWLWTEGWVQGRVARGLQRDRSTQIRMA